MYGETFCWADLDADGDLDAWLTAYPTRCSRGAAATSSSRTSGRRVRAALTASCSTRSRAGSASRSNVNRPEGAQLVDVDRDGDIDAYANGTLYQNVTATDGRASAPLVRNPTGIPLAGVLDEGCTVPRLRPRRRPGPRRRLPARTTSACGRTEGDGTFRDASDWLRAPDGGRDRGLLGRGLGPGRRPRPHDRRTSSAATCWSRPARPSCASPPPRSRVVPRVLPRRPGATGTRTATRTAPSRTCGSRGAFLRERAPTASATPALQKPLGARAAGARLGAGRARPRDGVRRDRRAARARRPQRLRPPALRGELQRLPAAERIRAHARRCRAGRTRCSPRSA